MRLQSGSRVSVLSALSLAVFPVSSALAAEVGAVTTFNTRLSSFALSHTADTSAANPQVFTVNIPGTSVPAASPATYQLGHTFSAVTQHGPSSTLSDVGLFEITNLLNLGVGLKAGTGITQTNVPGHAYTGPSVSEIDVDSVWNLGSSGFPTPGHLPGVSYQYPIGGIVGISGTDEFSVNLNFYDLAVSQSPVGTINADQVFSNVTASPLSFTSNITGAVLINGGVPLPALSQLELIGTIDFKATNDDSPSSLALTADGGVGVIDSTMEQSIPEPATASIALISTAGLLARRRRR